MHLFKKSILITGILFLSTFSLFSKPSKNDFNIPTNVQEKINKTEETSKSWYICEVKNKTKAGKVYAGPLDSKEEALLIWISNYLTPDKDYCIAKNKTYITKNPEKFYSEETEKVKKDIAKFGVQETYRQYFFTNYLTRPIKITLSDNESDKTNIVQSSAEENTTAIEQPTLEETPAAQTDNVEISKEDSVQSNSSQTEQPSTADTTEVQTTKSEPQELKIPETYAVQNEINETEQPTEEIANNENLESKNIEILNNESAIVEITNITDSQTQPLISFDEDKKKEEPEQFELSNAQNNESVITQNIPEVKQPEPEVKAFELPISTTPSTSISRYKKENLLDYAPKKQFQLPSDNEEENYYKKIDNPNQTDSKGVTLLMKAAKDGNNWELSNLLDSGADINAQDKDGWTALMYAVRYQENSAIVNQLISAGANIKTTNNFNLSALTLASTYNGNPEIIKKLLSYYSPSEKEVLWAFILLLSENSSSEYSRIAKIDCFIQKSVPLNSFYNGKTPLMYACQYNNSTNVIKQLLDYGALTTIRSSEGKTAFDYASENKSLNHDEIYWTLNKK